MVAELENPVTQTELEPVQPEEPTTTPVEAEVPSEPDPLDEYIKAEGLVDAEPSSTESDNRPDPELEARAQRLADQKLEEQRRVAEENGLLMSFREAAPRVRNFLAPFATGQKAMTYNDVEAVINYLNGIQGNAKQVYTKEAADSWTSVQINAAEKLFPKFSEGKYATADDFVKAIADKARDGYLSPKEVKKLETTARLEEHKRLMANPAALRSLLSKAEAPKSESSTGSAVSMNALNDPNADMEARAKAFERKYGFRP